MRLLKISATSALAVAAAAAFAMPAHAAPKDSDRDGMSNAWEIQYKLNLHSKADATGDLDGDRLSNLSEFKLGGNPHDEDTDNDGEDDGAEDRDNDGQSNEDEDDNDTDVCNGDRDGDGEDDEDVGDRFGTITSFDLATGTLVVTTVAGHRLSAHVAVDTEIEFDDEHHSSNSGDDSDEGDDEAGLAALVAGTGVAELDRTTGTVEGIELL